MSNQLEELQAKKYVEYLIAVDPDQWQWFAHRQCFEVGDAAARPRVYFDVDGQYERYILTAYLEVDGTIVGSNLLHVSKRPPADHDELLRHITEVDQPPLLVVLVARLIRNRSIMETAPRPDHLRVKIENYLTILKQKVLVDMPHNVQDRLMMLKIERNASRVRPKARRG